MTNTALITGANRGLGLEFVKQYATAGWQVHACCRAPEKAHVLANLANNNAAIQIHPLDVTDSIQITELQQKLAEQPIDLLINNAGVYGERQSLGTLNEVEIQHVFAVNAITPIKIAEAFMQNVANSKQKTIVSITSKMGSIDDNQSGGGYAYRASKSALNSMMKSLAIDLRPQQIITLLLHPGWVKTDMGGPNGLITAEQSVAGMRQIIKQATLAETGKFYAYDGKPIAW